MLFYLCYYFLFQISNESNLVEGQLYEGDEIITVNGIYCESRADAIQMVRAVEDELRLKIYR